MSSATNQYSEANINSVFIRFGMKWTLKAKELIALSCEMVSAIHSDLYNIKTIKDLSFCFCLEYQRMNSYCPYQISVKGSEVWSFQLLNNFILTQERAYYIRPFNQQTFLDSFNYRSYLNEENVEIHCLINIFPVSAGTPVKDEPSLLDFQKIVDIESLPCMPLPKDYTNHNVISFMQKGEIPQLNVDEAIKIISETKIHKCDVLKILCIEYLINNTTTQNLPKILKAAIEFGLSRLERSCSEKIARGVIRVV